MKKYFAETQHEIDEILNGNKELDDETYTQYWNRLVADKQCILTWSRYLQPMKQDTRSWDI